MMCDVVDAMIDDGVLVGWHLSFDDAEAVVRKAVIVQRYDV